MKEPQPSCDSKLINSLRSQNLVMGAMGLWHSAKAKAAPPGCNTGGLCVSWEFSRASELGPDFSPALTFVSES